MTLLQILITYGPPLIMIAFGYGRLTQRVKGVENRFREIDDVKQDIKHISSTLNQLVGKIDTFFNIFKEREK